MFLYFSFVLRYYRNLFHAGVLEVELFFSCAEVSLSLSCINGCTCLHVLFIHVFLWSCTMELNAHACIRKVTEDADLKGFL